MVFRRLVVMFMGCLGVTTCQTTPTDPPESTTHGSSISEDPSGTDPRKIRLNDGRSISYQERGVPKNKSIYKVIVVHGFASSKEMDFPASQELMEQLGIYVLLFDRAGYGESDPNPKRSLKTEAFDIQELADQLQLGSKFYVIGVSLGCYPAWSCLKRLPQRLAGVALIVPFVNYNSWSLPDNLTKDDYRKNMARWTIMVARYAPGLVHWWLTQKMFPSASVFDENPKFFSRKDLEVLKKTPGYKLFCQNKLKQPGVFDSLRRDVMAGFGKWDFDPLELSNPYPKNESSVHIWQGYEDKVVPVKLQRYISEKLPWIRYHEVPDGGHLLVYDSDVCEAVLRSLLLGEDPSYYRPKLAPINDV